MRVKMVVITCLLAFILSLGTMINAIIELGELGETLKAQNYELQMMIIRMEKLEDRLEILEEDYTVNQNVLNENNALRATINRMSYKDNVSRHGTYVRNTTPATDITLLQDLGVWTISYYTPTKEECGSNSGITASAKPVVAAYSCAADTSFWPFGTKLYVEGWGLVEVMDRGGAIKGPNRIDICISDRNQALRLGVEQRKVWLAL